MPKNLTTRYRVWRSDPTNPEGWRFLAGLPGSRADHARDIAAWARRNRLVAPTEKVKVLTTRYNRRGVIRNITTVHEPLPHPESAA